MRWLALVAWVDAGDWCWHWPRCPTIEACDDVAMGRMPHGVSNAEDPA